jgi:hypothetical protein
MEKYTKYFKFFLVLSLFQSCNSQKESTQDVIEKEMKEPLYSTNVKFTVLSKAKSGSFVNYNLLIDSKEYSKKELIEVANQSKMEFCQNENCNMVSCWDNITAFDLYNDSRTRTEDKKWLNKNQVKFSEGLLFDNYVYAGEIVIYPLLDSEYLRLGGKMVKPN